MGKVAVRNQPCLNTQTCNSHDARQIYEDGTSFCFSCKSFFPKQENEEIIKEPVTQFRKESMLTLDQIKELPSRALNDRKISKEVVEFFKVKVSFDSNTGNPDAHFYPYDDEKGYKIRKLPKSFSWVNKSNSLFGKERFAPNGKRLIITEGEIDALSIAQASYDKYNKVYPVVALSSAVMTKSLLENRDWIRSFSEVVLCLDNDEAGNKAKEEALRIVGIDKAKIAVLPEKDPNDVLVKHGGMRLLQCVFDAAPYVPSGIIGKEELWEALASYNSIPSQPYPDCLAGVNSKLKGMREGEITLFISGTGSGKSTILREVILHLLDKTDSKIGVVSLEESPQETARKLSGMAINKNPAKEEIPLDDLKVGFDKVFGSDRIVLLDHQGAINDDSIIDKLEYMCLSGCKYLFIDHITILVSEGSDGLVGNEAQDKVMNDLLRLVKRHPVWVGLVSHLRKPPGGGKSFEEGKLPSIDDIRGSGSIKQISFDIISFARNLTAIDERVRNSIKMRILKSRYTGLTGVVAGAYYNYDSGRLIALDEIPEEEFVTI